MGLLSRIKGALLDLFTRKQVEKEEAKQAERTPWKHRFIHQVRLRTSTGRPIFGPSFPAERANHHVSRQTSRGYLRARFFGSVSAGNPLMSRRDRRRYARLLACLEYRRMMVDPANVVEHEQELSGAHRGRLYFAGLDLASRNEVALP